MSFSVPLGHGDQLSGCGVYDGVLAAALPGRAGCPGDAVAAGTAARPAAATVMLAAMATSLFMGMSPHVMRWTRSSPRDTICPQDCPLSIPLTGRFFVPAGYPDDAPVRPV